MEILVAVLTLQQVLGLRKRHAREERFDGNAFAVGDPAHVGSDTTPLTAFKVFAELAADATRLTDAWRIPTDYVSSQPREDPNPVGLSICMPRLLGKRKKRFVCSITILPTRWRYNREP